MRAQLDIHKYRNRLKACSISTSWPELSCQGNRAYRENFRQKKKHGCERIKENRVFCYGQENQSKKKELFEEWEGSFLILANVSLPPFSARQQGKNYLFLEKKTYFCQKINKSWCLTTADANIIVVKFSCCCPPPFPPESLNFWNYKLFSRQLCHCWVHNWGPLQTLHTN